MYGATPRDCYWPNMTRDVNKAVSNCYGCGKSCTTPNQKPYLQLFPIIGPLKFVAVDILGPLPNTTRTIQHAVIITDRCLKLKRAVSSARTITPAVASIFFYVWVIRYGILPYRLIDNRTLFVCRFFGTLYTHIGTKHMTPTIYPPQSSRQVKRYDQKIRPHLHHYVARH